MSKISNILRNKLFTEQFQFKHFTKSRLRLLRMPTFVLGPLYKRSLDIIEIDITYKCNLKCYNCNRSCRQAPSNDSITIEQIKKFLQESISKNINWRIIRILGGEPTLHKDLFSILDLLLNYKRNYSPELNIELVSNGCGQRTCSTLQKIPSQIKIINTAKKSPVQIFRPFNVAPLDIVDYNRSDFSNGCYVTTFCGVGLTPYGYYCCAVAGGIDRVFGFDLGRKSLPLKDDPLTDQMKVFCRLCGNFIRENILYDREVISSTWDQAYERYKTNLPILTRY